MLVECGNCGGPLDVAPGARSAVCKYCGTKSAVAQVRTLSPQTPPGWRPPPVWMPPPHMPAPSHVQLNYKKTRGCGLAIALVMTLSILLFVGGIFAIVIFSMRGSDAYTESLAFLTKNPQVVKDLGKPIEDGLMPTGSISTSGPSGRADLDISLSGPKGEGTASVSLVKLGGNWQITNATWHHDGKSTTLATGGGSITITTKGPVELSL